MEDKVFTEQVAQEQSMNALIIMKLEEKSIFFHKALVGYKMLKLSNTEGSDLMPDILNYIASFYNMYNMIRPHIKSFLIVNKNPNDSIKKFMGDMDKLIYDSLEEFDSESEYLEEFEKTLKYEKELNEILRELGYTKERQIQVVNR